jgi:hypothetical protein
MPLVVMISGRVAQQLAPQLFPSSSPNLPYMACPRGLNIG